MQALMCGSPHGAAHFLEVKVALVVCSESELREGHLKIWGRAPYP